jgi:hypothetical protein
MASASLLPAVQGMFSAASSLGYNKKGAAHDIYEGYVLTLLLKAADNQLWKWQLRDGKSKPTSHVLFRLGPGRLPSGNFTHVLLTKPGRADLEAHIGVKVVGKAPYVKTKKKKSASVVHEFDLLVLRSAVANFCRAVGVDPSHSSVIMHAEAKYYGGNLPLPLGRAVVGLAAECDLAGKSVLVTNQNGPTVEDLIAHYGVDFRFLVTPSGKGESHLIGLFEQFLIAAP